MPDPPSFEGLERAACAYLARYAASAEGVRRVLRRRVLRAAEANRIDPAEGLALAEQVLAKLRSDGLVDDEGFARARAGSLLRQGRAPGRVRMRLIADGVEPETASRAAEEAAGEAPGGAAGAELAAAIRTARRRRLGPFAPDPARRAERRSRDLASLARAGFPLGLARVVVEAEDEDALDRMVQEAAGDGT